MKNKLLDHLVVLRGGGDISTGIAITLWRVGYHVLILEQARPASSAGRFPLLTACTAGRKPSSG